MRYMGALTLVAYFFLLLFLYDIYKKEELSLSWYFIWNLQSFGGDLNSGIFKRNKGHEIKSPLFSYRSGLKSTAYTCSTCKITAWYSKKKYYCFFAQKYHTCKNFIYIDFRVYNFHSDQTWIKTPARLFILSSCLNWSCQKSHKIHFIAVFIEKNVISHVCVMNFKSLIFNSLLFKINEVYYL